jgi:aminoglycoside phosphotransferase (APT) family kinase protein
MTSDGVTSLKAELKSAEQSVRLDWESLRRYLAEQGMKFALDPPPRQFSGGLANLNYLISLDGREIVLRRPPLGELPPGAYDMGREHRILSRLWRKFPLAPRGLHLCENAHVIGAPFQIIEYRPGFAIRAEMPARLASIPNVGVKLSEHVVSVLARLHAVDPADVGLEDLGRPEGFLARAVEGWAKRAAIATDAPNPMISTLVDWLRNNRVPDGAPTLLHNDIKLDNVLLHERDLTPTAVLDWDQGTRGNPLFDLATLLSYWTEASDPPAMQELKQMPTGGYGFPTRQAIAEAYAQATGRDLSHFLFHRVLAMFKLAVIFYQLHHRYAQGATDDARYAGFGRLADGIVEFAYAIAKGHVF